MTLERKLPFHEQPLFLLLLLVFCPLTAPTRGEDNGTAFHTDALLGTAFRLTGLLLHRCLHGAEGSQDVVSSVQSCLKRRSLLALDRIRTIDHLRIYDGVELVRSKNETVADRCVGRNNNETYEPWAEKVIEKLDRLFESHRLKFSIEPQKFIEEARRKHHQNSMMALTLFGTLAVSMIAVPLGFQFLAVLGGKALLLAKLALILTSIQGLKKIATSNLNYGLYQAPPMNPWHGYDRRWQYDVKDDPHKYQAYDQPDAVLDLIHPLSPRSTSDYETIQQL